MTLTATCHCGATRIELPHLPADIKECNCSYCQRIAGIWGYFDPDEINIVSADKDTVYSASDNINRHHFCANCGSTTHGSSPDWGSLYNLDGTLKPGKTAGVPTDRLVAVNLRMIDDLDLATLDIVKVDGRKSW